MSWQDSSAPFTPNEKAKLSGIEDNATIDQTGAEIKTAYEANSNTNAFVDADVTKLSGIEDNATIDQTGAEIRIAYQAACMVVTKTVADSPYTATSSDDTILCNATDGAITINLPTSIGISGKKYNIKKIDSSANDVTVYLDGTETIDGESNVVISIHNDSYTVQSDGSNWYIL